MAKNAKKSGSKKPRSKAQKDATKRMLAAKAAKSGGSKPKKGGAAKKAAKGRKLSAAHKQKLKAGSKKYWSDRKGSGTKASHIPLKVLKTNHENLGKLIKKRQGDSGWN